MQAWRRIALGLLALSAVPSEAAAAPSRIPLRLHVVHVEGEPVAAADFLGRQIARANAIFAPYDVQFVRTQTVALEARHAALETAEDRDALAIHARRGAIDCFVVGSLRDVDEPERMRQGVHWWRGRSRKGAHYVILSASAGPDVLAHELGHYLGNPRHSDTPGNLMSYDRGPPVPPFLDSAQVRRMRRALRGYVRRGELRLIEDPGSRGDES